MKRSLACLAGVAMTTTAVAQNPAPIPIIDFIKPSEALSAQLSPNGEYIAVSRLVNDNKHGVGVTELATNKVTATLAFSMGESVGAYEWAGPKRLVVSLARSWGRLEQPKLIGELFGIDADGKNGTYLFGFRARDKADTRIQVGTARENAWAFLVSMLPAMPGQALIQVRPWGTGNKNFFDIVPRLVRMDVATGKRDVLEALTLLEPSIITDDAGANIMVAGGNRNGDTELQARAAGEQKWRTIPIPGGPEADIYMLEVARDGSAGYFSIDAPGSPKCLYEYSFQNGTVAKLACTNYNRVVFTATERKPMALRLDEGLSRYEYLLPDHPEAKRLRAVSAIFKGQHATLISTTLDGSKVLVDVVSDRNPGGYYLLDETTKSLRFLVPRRKWIDPRLMAPVAVEVIKASDGLRIPVLLTARDGLKTRKAPLVVLPHGGPHGVRDYWAFDGEAQLLANRGYAVLQVNFRGSGGFGYDFEAAGYRAWGTRIQQDIADATRWAIAQGIADPARICIYGASFGGYSALMSAANEPDLYKCAAGYAGVYDLREQVDDTDGADYVLGRRYLARWLGTDATLLRDQSPVTHAARIKAALLIAHGTADKRVPFSQAELLRDALDAAKKPYEWLEYAGEEHGFFKTENEIDFYTKLLAFLDQHIGPGAGGKG